jgi:hypothetical protein
LSFAAQQREGTPVDTPGSHSGIAIDDSGGLVSGASENATGVESDAQQEPPEGIEASPTFVLRGNVERRISSLKRGLGHSRISGDALRLSP